MDPQLSNNINLNYYFSLILDPHQHLYLVIGFDDYFDDYTTV